MNNRVGIARMASLGAVALALVLGGCSQSGNPMGPTAGAPGIMPGGQAGTPVGIAQNNQADEDSADVTSPDGFHRHHHHHHRGFCAPVTIQQNFNGQAIAKGSWILFTSVAQFPGNQNGARIEMKDSKVVFSDGIHNYTVKGPDSTFTYGTANVRLRYDPPTRRNANGWVMRAPMKTAGRDFLTDMVYRVPHALPGNIQNVTWSARFYSRSAIQQVQWQWGGAVYTRLSDSYQRLAVKPLDDQKYPPYNNDQAGTPERFKGWVTQGATGGGGNNYTGVGGPNQNVQPCR